MNNKKTEIEEQIKNLQRKKIELIEKEKLIGAEKKKIEAVGKQAMNRLYGLSKAKATEKVKFILREVCNNDGGVKEVFGINSNYFVATSATIEDIENDSFFIDLLIAEIGMKTFKDVEGVYMQGTRRAINVLRGFYKKLAKREIVNYLKKEYPLREEIHWVFSKKIGRCNSEYMAKIGNLQKTGRISIHFDKKPLSDNKIHKGDRVAIAVLEGRILVKKNENGYKLTSSGAGEKLNVTIKDGEVNVVENKIFNNLRTEEGILIYSE